MRNRIPARGKEVFLFVVLSDQKHRAGSAFAETTIVHNQQWAKKQLATLRHAYAKAPYVAEVFEQVKTLLSAAHRTIGALSQAFIERTAQHIGIGSPFVRSSKLQDIKGRRDHRLLAICAQLSAGTYLTASKSAAYIESDCAFEGSGVALRYHYYDYPTYVQHGDGFITYISVDLLMNVSYESALDVIRSGRREPLTSAQMKDAA